MPELPDVEAIRRHLVAQGLVGRKFTGAAILWPRAVRTPPLEEFVLGITGRRIQELGRRAKFLLFRLDQGQTLIVHLRMTGSLLVEPATQPPHPMTRNSFSLDDGRELQFVDPRKLGMLWLVKDPVQVLNDLGPEPLEPSFTVSVLWERLKGHKAPIKALLCDQTIVAGIGNIYADEVLFTSGIHPLTFGSDLKAPQVKKMHHAIVAVLSRAIDRLAPMAPRGGPPTESPEGLMGLRVPRKGGQPCLRCATAIVQVPVRGRSTYFCPRCQK
jgi:formamidopyrimidine-DNA glycosylase